MCAPLSRFLQSKWATPLAFVGMLSVIPIIILTPARPLVPLALLEKANSFGPVSKILDKYRMWETLRDDLKPMRQHLPKEEKVIGYAGAFRDTSYGLWKPFGSRVLPEIGVPIKNPARHVKVPNFVVATENGIQQRFGLSLDEWMHHENKTVAYTFKRATGLEADSAGARDEWFLLRPR